MFEEFLVDVLTTIFIALAFVAMATAANYLMSLAATLLF